jgi:hypothetical protein
MMSIPVQTTADRKQAILRLAALKAWELPLLPSGFWFHSDVRDNFYYAIHLFAYSVDTEASGDWNEEQRGLALTLSVKIIEKVLRLQVQDAEHPMYGHWPLNLGSDPAAAKANPLPVELMGCLLIFFYNKYQSLLPIELSKARKELSSSLHIYNNSDSRNMGPCPGIGIGFKRLLASGKSSRIPRSTKLWAACWIICGGCARKPI